MLRVEDLLGCWFHWYHHLLHGMLREYGQFRPRLSYPVVGIYPAKDGSLNTLFWGKVSPLASCYLSCNAQHRPAPQTVPLVSSHEGYGNSISHLIQESLPPLGFVRESGLSTALQKNRFWQMQRS